MKFLIRKYYSWKINRLRKQADAYGCSALVALREGHYANDKAIVCSVESIVRLCNGNDGLAEKLAWWADCYRQMADNHYDFSEDWFAQRRTVMGELLKLTRYCHD